MKIISVILSLKCPWDTSGSWKCGAGQPTDALVGIGV